MRVLVLEPSPAIRSLFSAILSRTGYTIEVVDRQLDDLDSVVRFQPDLIILGYVSGYLDSELAELCRLREHSTLNNIPVIVCSTAPQHLTRLASHNWLTNVTMLSKPFSYTELLTLVKTFISPDTADGSR